MFFFLIVKGRIASALKRNVSRNVVLLYFTRSLFLSLLSHRKKVHDVIWKSLFN